MSSDRRTWDLAAACEALGAGQIALWRWEPDHDRLSLAGATRAVGLAALAPDASSAALRAVIQPQDRGLAEEMLKRQPPGTEVAVRLRLRGDLVCAWRGTWLEDGRRAAGMVTLETGFAAAHRDPLTGLLDRASFLARARERLQRPAAYELVTADLDRLSRLNEALGHERADLVLATLGARLSAAFPTGALLGRIGEDEFAVLVPVGARPMADEIRRVLAQPLRVAGFDIHPSLSVGAVTAQGGADAPDAAELLRRAGLALESARRHGRGAAIYGRGLDGDSLSRLALEGDLKGAFARGELVAYYQPVVRLACGRLSGFEALVRWRHPRRGVLGPEQFLPLCGEMGLMGELASMMMRDAAGQLATWRRRHGAAQGLSVAVNLSTGEIDRPELVAEVAAIRKTAGLPPGALTLEVTEGDVMRDPARAASVLAELRAAGAAIALDDFGTGFSSLSYLTRLPFDTLKIDRSFVRTMATHERSTKIVSSVVKLGRDLDLEVVAEGVENAGVARRLVELGCDFGQGFGYAPALSAQEAEAYLRDSAPDRLRA